MGLRSSQASLNGYHRKIRTRPHAGLGAAKGNGYLVTTAWRFLRLQVEETANYHVILSKYTLNITEVHLSSKSHETGQTGEVVIGLV